MSIGIEVGLEVSYKERKLEDKPTAKLEKIVDGWNKSGSLKKGFLLDVYSLFGGGNYSLRVQAAVNVLNERAGWQAYRMSPP